MIAIYSADVLPQTLNWQAGNSNVLEINATNGTVIGKTAGMSTITASKVICEELCSVNFSMEVTLIPEGLYFLKNRQTGGYVDIQSHSMVDGNSIVQWQFGGGHTQKWSFGLLKDGYYTIRSNNSDVPYYLGVINDSSELNVDIVLCSGTITDGMKWKIAETTSGAFKLIPKTGEISNYVLATSTSDTTNGAKLIQRAYVYNDSYRDEWKLCMLKDYTLMYIGYEVGDPAMPSIKSNVESMLRENCNMDGYAYTDVGKEEIIFRLASSEIFSCITHGTQTQIVTSDGAITISDINALDDDALEYLRFVCLGACSTGRGGAGANNFVNALFDKGAYTVLGFQNDILVDETNCWMELFMGALTEGKTVEEARDFADTEIQEDPKVGGRTTYTTYGSYTIGNLYDAPCA